MPVIDVDILVTAISDELPSGDNMEYEPEFGALEREAQGKDEHVMGDEVVEAEEPDWSAVFSQAQELLSSTKDLRVATNLARAAASLHGVTGLAEGLGLVRGLLEQHWDTVHPQLDAEDNDDPTFRVNSVMPLGDREGLLNNMLKMNLVSSKAVGRFNLRDIKVAKGELGPMNGQDSPPDMPLINAAFMDCDLDELQADAERIDQSAEHVVALDALFADKIGAANSPDFGALAAELKGLKVVYAENLNARGIGVEIPDGAEGVAGGGATPIAGDVNTREDAIRMIDKICTYYERNEPSSPVPMLLQRAKKLVSKDFLDIMRELTPDAVAQAESLGGIKHDDGY